MAGRRIWEGVEYPLEINSEIQGVHVRFEEPEDFARWVLAEGEFWEKLDLAETIFEPSFGQLRINARQIYADVLSSVRPGNADGIKNYIDAANRLDLVIGQSKLGERLAELVGHDQQASTWMLLCLTKNLSQQVTGHQLESVIARQRVQMFISPALIEAQGLARLTDRDRQSAALARQTADSVALAGKQVTDLAASTLRNQQISDDWRAQVEQAWRAFEEEQKTSLASLHDLYHKQLQTQAAAYFWKLKSEAASAASWWALLIFVVATVVPLILVPWLLWEPIEGFIARMMSASNGVFTLTPVIVLTIPVLGYAWVLRQISRIFLQNRTIADDAGYRRVMTMTFLGLTKDKTSGVTDTERAIILNALFRPTPPNTADEGPPTGLLDILKSK